MNASKLALAMLAAAGLCLAGGAGAQAINKEARDLAVKNAESQYKVDIVACDGMSGNGKDICVEEAKGKEKVTKSDAEASFQNTPKAREEARVARAEATFAVAKERCDDLSGNAKDVCVKEAQAAHVKANADAKVDRVAADANKESADKTADARRDASADKRDAQYKVAIEKCDALAGSEKDTCVRDAKMRYGKS